MTVHSAESLFLCGSLARPIVSVVSYSPGAWFAALLLFNVALIAYQTAKANVILTASSFSSRLSLFAPFTYSNTFLTQAAVQPQEERLIRGAMAIDLMQLSKTQLARRIAEQLGETQPDMLNRIRQIVLSHGKPYAVKLLLRTQQIEAQGGWAILKEACQAEASPERRRPSSVYLKLHQVYQRSRKKNSAPTTEQS